MQRSPSTPLGASAPVATASAKLIVRLFANRYDVRGGGILKCLS